MIQFNLLPDVKLEYIKTERIKHAVVSGAIIATSVAVAIFLLLFITVHVVQQQIISSKTATIKEKSGELKDTTDLPKILTIQNQLISLPGLHASKPAAIRTFSLIQQITSTDISLTDVTVDYTANTVSISGEAPSLGAINTMVDTVKYAEYRAQQTASDSKSAKVFSNVVLSQFSRDSDKGSFTITASYDPKIFDNTIDVAFDVPTKITTRSVEQQPTLFVKPSTEKEE